MHSIICLFLLVAQVLALRGHKSRQQPVHDVTNPIIGQLWGTSSKLPGNASFDDIQKRQAVVSTCGFLNGDASQPRTANPGFACRFDTIHALWGFCPTSVIVATDCGLAGNCVDSHACTTGCGLTGIAGITTFTCGDPKNAFCSTVLLTEGPDQVYSYIACGPTAIVDHYLASPTTTTTTSKSTSTSVVASSTSTARAAATSSTPARTSTTVSSITSSSDASSSVSITSQSSSPILTSAPTLQFGTASAAQSSSTSSSATNPTSSNNLGPIIGGVIGGLAIICFFVLGILYLRRDARKNRPVGEPTPSGWWKGPYRTTEMQTAGLHEVEGNGPVVHEADANWNDNGNGAGNGSNRFSRNTYGGYKQGKGQTYELG